MVGTVEQNAASLDPPILQMGWQGSEETDFQFSGTAWALSAAPHSSKIGQRLLVRGAGF